MIRRPMKKTATHKPAAFNRAEFEKCFLAADYDRCVALVNQAATTDEVLLAECEVQLRKREYGRVIEELSAQKFKSRRSSSYRDILLGAALGFTKDYVSGRARLTRALSSLAPKDDLRSEASFFLALNAWMQHENRECEDLLTSLLASDQDNVRARANILQSWVYARRRGVYSQAQSLLAALDALDRADYPDEYLRSLALLTLALLCREMPLGEVTQRVRYTYESLPWTPALRVQHFQVTRFLGWIEALQGNEISAFRYFKEAHRIAPSDHWKVLCLLDRAALAKSTGEVAFANEQLHEAHELAERISWSETEDEERSALLVLAELFADCDPSIAQRYIAQFRTLSRSVLPTLAYGSDPRVKAFAAYSGGVALLRLGELVEAREQLEEAWAIFEDFEYGWRAALTAIALFQCTGDERWLIRAKQRIKPWPHSWVVRQIDKAVPASQTSLKLPKSQYEVLQLILKGASNADIAQQLGRSPHTIRNQVAVLFQRFNVKTRTELATKAIRLRLSSS